MEKEPKIINLQEKKKEKEERIRAGKYFEKNKVYKFDRELDVLHMPDYKEDEAESQNVLVPDKLPPGEYLCLGFFEEVQDYLFWGKPMGSDKETRVIVPADSLLNNNK